MGLLKKFSDSFTGKFGVWYVTIISHIVGILELVRNRTLGTEINGYFSASDEVNSCYLKNLILAKNLALIFFNVFINNLEG